MTVVKAGPGHRATPCTPTLPPVARESAAGRGCKASGAGFWAVVAHTKHVATPHAGSASHAVAAAPAHSERTTVPEAGVSVIAVVAVALIRTLVVVRRGRG